MVSVLQLVDDSYDEVESAATRATLDAYDAARLRWPVCSVCGYGRVNPTDGMCDAGCVQNEFVVDERCHFAGHHHGQPTTGERMWTCPVCWPVYASGAGRLGRVLALLAYRARRIVWAVRA